ncbi:uncharacterized protein E0L32_011903 [Thyridium curvatum]|uniref:5'-3' DNA helicase ZGRF1-like N-terminal domain-containing protein n=1 Tax=Thyridium curvatum TaxID=1093900 RepID=A0A507BDM0_9PEZI|nr:uncharacterized protein E0L32_011903 [Thyridium curvatum]TPX18037.1 hypothetical protein E0L32_011903 [Thyridium curvatum]
MASRSSAAAQHSPHQQQRSSTTTTAPVLEYLCLFTHDLKRKQKRWQDGKLRYHAFNGKAVVHDERGNLVGDAHAHDPPREGDEMQLERGGGVLVQVASEVVGVQQQDLSAVVDRRVAEREERARAKVTAAAAAARSSVGRMGRPATGPVVVHTPVRSSEADHMRHRPLARVIGTPTGHHGRALVPSESPFEQRHHQQQQQQQQISMNHTAGEAVTPASVAQPAAKRRRYEDSPPSKAGYAQNLFGAKLNLSSQPTSSLQSLRAAASQRRIAERAARAEHEEEERELDKGPATRPAARDFGRPALGASRSQEIVVSDDEEEDAAPAREVSRQEARLPAARPTVRPVVNKTPRRSAVGQMVRQSIDAAMQQRSHEPSTSPGQSMQGERRNPTTDRQESQRPRAPDPIPPESEIIDIDADDEPVPQPSVPARHVPVAQQRKRNQLLSRATNRGNVSIGDVENTSRTAKDAAPISVEPNAGEDGQQAAHAPARDGPRTELRIKSRKKRGLLMVTEKIAPPKPASEKPKAQPAERESSETLDAEKSDPFASSPPGRTGEIGLDSAPGRGSRNNNTAEPIGHLAQEVSNYDQEGLDLLFDNDETHFPVAEEPVASRVLKDCTNTIQSRNTDVQDKRKPTPELAKQSSRLEEVTTAPTALDASQDAGLKEKGAELVGAEVLSEDESDNVQIVRKRTKSNTKKTRKEATSPVVPDASGDDDEPIVPTTTKRLAQRASRNARAASASVDPSSDEEPVVARKTNRLIRIDTRKTESAETSLDLSSDEEIRPRQRSKRTAQRHRKEEPVVMSPEEDYSDQAPPAKAKSKRRLRSKSRDDEELAALRDDDDDDEASEDMPAPPPKKRARKRAKDKSEQDDESATSAREAKPAPRLARLSKKSVKSRELIGFNFDEPKGPMTSLIGAAKTVVSIQSRNASDTSVENNREGSDSRAQLGNDRALSDVPAEPVTATSPKRKSVEPVAVEVVKPVEEEPAAVQESGCKQVLESAPATAAPIAIKETMAIASKIIDAWESQHGKATSTTMVQEPARTVNGLVLDSASASGASIAKQTEQTNKANESAVQGTTEAVPTVPSLPQGDSTLSTKSAPAETTAAEPDKTDETPCEPRDRPQPQPRQPPGRLFRRQASVGMPPPAPAAGSGAPRIANPASRGRKAALKSDAAGQVPQSILSASTLYGGAGGVGGSMMAMMQMQMQMMNAQGGPAAAAAAAAAATATAEALEPPPPKKVKKMTFPGFQPAGGSGPWSREAFDLLEMGRPL